MMATESVALSQVRLIAALSRLEYWSALGNRQQIAIARDLVAHCTMQLSIEIGESKIFKSKGPVFTQFCSKF